MKRIVITGATGFIGAVVLKRLIDDGNQAIVLLRKESQVKRIEGLSRYQTVYYENLNQEDLIDALTKYRPDAFIHLAWKGVGSDGRNERFQITENLPFTLQSVELAHIIGCQHWIGIGSQAEYGIANRKVSENDPTMPITLYGKAKLASCWAALGLAEALKIKASWLRVFSTYGIGGEPTWFIPYVISEIKKGNSPKLTKCEQLWDYLNVEDAARAILSVLYEASEGLFNIGSGQAIPLKSVVELIRSNINPNLPVNYGAISYQQNQIMHLEADISRIHQLTGWIPEISIEEGIKILVDGRE